MRFFDATAPELWWNMYLVRGGCDLCSNVFCSSLFFCGWNILRFWTAFHAEELWVWLLLALGGRSYMGGRCPGRLLVWLRPFSVWAFGSITCHLTLSNLRGWFAIITGCLSLATFIIITNYWGIKYLACGELGNSCFKVVYTVIPT